MRGGGARKTKRRNIKRDSPVAGAYIDGLGWWCIQWNAIFVT